ncbi:DUF1850 domain-containing protein [Caldifermentibacillus hisashii]|uniref:DUF1850 domain-containing protein n=1 Tax=Caldifermentibacillus hisashii TaxID=996558 RepID=UPI002E21BFAA|nr:DUF1850 domain-containing protein [Caldifermentibacillus hisashii]
MKRKKNMNTLIIIIVFLVIMLTVLFIPFRKSLVFYERNTGQIAAYLPVKEGDTFQIIFTHSIHLSDVIEKYRVLPDDTMEEYEFVFEEFGIGMPSNAETGQTFEYKDGKYHIKDVGNVFPSMMIRNGKTVSKHRLVWGENEEHIVKFNDYLKPGEIYKVQVDHLSLWQSVKGVEIRD